MKIFSTLTLAGLLLVPIAASAGSELRFASDGGISAKGLMVQQIAGTNLFVRALWGETYIRLVVVSNSSTKITKAYGEAASIGDIKDKDTIDVEGRLSSGGDSLVINASSIRDANLLVAGKTISGMVIALDSAENSITVEDKVLGKTAVAVGGAAITKGVRSVGMGEVKVGDKVLSAEGSYDYSTKKFTATAISVHQEASIFKARNFEGSLKSISSTSLPTTVVVTVGSTDYTVYLSEKSAILSKSRKSATLSRFVVGDSVRFWGSIREANLSEVDAEILRDLTF